mmetsp:Transcript_5876/g.8643  ORF Transcript_5876/g.8643 Transcript_5876/m.8643 type:complete len:642 (+) Transcript_5876:46-1971(+)
MTDPKNASVPTPLADTVAEVSAQNLKLENGNDDSTDSLGSGSMTESDSIDWEGSDNEAWPASTARYAPVGDANSELSRKGSLRLSREFTMGVGFHHLNEGGNRAMFASPENTILSPPATCVGMSHYNEAAIALMKRHNLKDKGLCVSQKTYLEKTLLITDTPHAIRLFIGDENGPCIVGVALIRSEVTFTTGTLSEKEPPLTFTLEPDFPIIERIEMHSCTWLEGKNRVEKKISYLRLLSRSDSVVFGQVHTPGFDGKRSIYSEVEIATGNLCISGIGYFVNRPVSLQIVDLGVEVNYCKDSCVLDAIRNTVYYGHEMVGVNLIRTRAPEVEFLDSISTEDDAVWGNMLTCMNAVDKSSPSYGELLPNVVNSLECSLNGDVHTIHSILRMDRFLTYIIQEKKTIKTFENDHLNFYAKLIPLKQMWGIYSNTIERIERLHRYEPQLNSFNVAFVQGTKDYLMRAIFIFLTQTTMLVLTMSHIWDNRFDACRIPDLLQLIVSISGTVVVSFMAKQSRDNFNDFADIFPDYTGTVLYKIDMASNYFGGFLVSICTLLLLLMTNDNLDIVLNATALLFVMELDELLVDSNPVWVTSGYRSYFMKEIIKGLNKADKRYWDFEYLRKNRGEHYQIHTPSCSFLFLDK